MDFKKMCLRKYVFVNNIVIILGVAIAGACSLDNSERNNEIENIPIELQEVSSDVSSFIEKIEIVPLETNDSSLIGAYRKAMYDKDMDIYAMYGRDQIVVTFSGDGKFIGSSKKMKGEGPQEYYMAIDMKFNPFLNGIDLLNPYGVIYTYTPAFDLISIKKINPEFFVDALMALDVDDYIFSIPSIWVNQEVTFVNTETQQSHMAVYDGTISSGNTMDRDCFHKIGNDFYFVPKGINYYFYRIDEINKTLVPIIFLDFGNAEIKENKLPGVAAGKRTKAKGTKPDKKRDALLKEMQERSQYIRDNDFIVPLVKFFNDDYVYIHFAKGRVGLGGNYIYNRKKKKGFLLKDGKPFIMPPCFAIIDNVLMTICDAYHIPELVNVDLMTIDEIEKMEQLKDDDNPVILKYYLRK